MKGLKETDRVERLLAMLLLQQMKSSSQQEKIVVLSASGFTNVEIADLLGTTGPVVSQSLYTARSTSTKRKSAKRLVGRKKS